MKRLIAVLVILVLILSVCTYSYCLFAGTREEMLGLLDNIEAAALAERDKQQVMALCEDYSARWQSREKQLMRFIRHPQLDEISSLTAELRYLASGEGYSHLLAAIDRIRVNLDRVGDAEFFNG